MIGLYAKAIAAAVVAGLMAVTAALADNTISPQEWVGVAVATVTGLALVWRIPNQPEHVVRYGKAIAAALVAALGVVGTGLTDGALGQQEIVTAVIALIVGSGLVAITPNAAQSDYQPRYAATEG